MMPTAHEKIYREYLERLSRIDVSPLPERLGVDIRDGDVIIPLFGRPYRVAAGGIAAPSGDRPSLDICVILSRYLLMAPASQAEEEDWVNFRDLKDSGPLTVYFDHNVEGAFKKRFSGKLRELEAACHSLGCRSPELPVMVDLSCRFQALPKVPLTLLFNDLDDEFPARCSILYERRAESYLDAECLAMLGRSLYTFILQAPAGHA